MVTPADPRNLFEKLMAFATQDESPTERDNARAMLATRGMWPPPPKPPTATAAPAPEPFSFDDIRARHIEEQMAWAMQQHAAAAGIHFNRQVGNARTSYTATGASNTQNAGRIYIVFVES